MPPSEMTATSVVPPPISTTMEPRRFGTGRPAPMAAAIGSSIRNTLLAPAPSADSLIARRSTWVEPQGTQMMMRGLGASRLRRMHRLDEVLQHLLGDGEIGDHAVLHRADGLDVARHPAEHLLGLQRPRPHHLLAAGTTFLADRDDGRFIQHDAFAAHVDERVGSAQVDGQIAGEIAAQEAEHAAHGCDASGVR